MKKSLNAQWYSYSLSGASSPQSSSDSGFVPKHNNLEQHNGVWRKSLVGTVDMALKKVTL
jgi:hypothetical protein